MSLGGDQEFDLLWLPRTGDEVALMRLVHRTVPEFCCPCGLEWLGRPLADEPPDPTVPPTRWAMVPVARLVEAGVPDIRCPNGCKFHRDGSQSASITTETLRGFAGQSGLSLRDARHLLAGFVREAYATVIVAEDE